MNFLRKRLDILKKPFEKGQKLEKFAPAINAFDTFLFVPNHTTKKGAHIRDAVDLKRTMVTVIIALMPALIYGIYNTGYQYYAQTGEAFTFIDAFIHGSWKIVPMIIVSYVVGLSIEFGFAVYRGHEVNEGYLVTGLLIPMIMPVDIPLWMVAVSTAFAVLIAKEAFGGTGMNILNPALTARAFAFFAYPTYMSGNKVWVSEASNVDAISGETLSGGERSMNVLSLEKSKFDIGYKLRFESAVESDNYFEKDIEFEITKSNFENKHTGNGFIRYIRFVEL